METSPVDSPAETLVCENCQTVNSVTQKFCPQCGFPIGGTRDEQIIFRGHIAVWKQLLKESQRNINLCKKMLYVLAALNIVLGLIAGFKSDDFPTMISEICVSLLFLILTAWADRNPFGAILTAFIVYVTLNIATAIDNPPLLVRGGFYRIVCIVLFIGGIRSAHQVRMQRAALEKLKDHGIGKK